MCGGVGRGIDVYIECGWVVILKACFWVDGMDWVGLVVSDG